MRVLSTRDVDLESLRDFAAELYPELDVQVNESQTYLLSAEAPSCISLLAEADWWVKVLAGYAVLYIAEIVKEAAKDTWKNRTKAAAGIGATGGALRKLATGIANLHRRLSDRTRVRVGLPVPDEFSSTRLELLGSDPNNLALQLALFIHHLPALSALIRAEGLDQGKAAGAIRLILLIVWASIVACLAWPPGRACMEGA
ncbi:MAG: hypothetical protein HYZ81_06660 [Nitrospinae bacterium]|nr:hypothetical protein [Nitrospinota bacterium]